MNIPDIYKNFSTEEICINYLESIKWEGKLTCSYCGNEHKTKKKRKDGKYICSKCHCTFHVCIGTIFHGTQIPLQKWFLALSLVLGTKREISSYQLARSCGVTQPTAWSMMKRIRKAMKGGDNILLQGIIEMDETYVGGKPRESNVRKTEYEKDSFNKRRRGSEKTPLLGMVERKGSVRAEKTEIPNKHEIDKMIGTKVDWRGSILISR